MSVPQLASPMFPVAVTPSDKQPSTRKHSGFISALINGLNTANNSEVIMRKAAFSMAVLLLSAVWVVAQTTGTGQPQTATQPPSQTGTMTPGTGQNPQTPNTTGQMPGNTQTGTSPAGTTTPSTQTGAAPQAGATAQPGATTPAPTGPQQTVEGCLGGTPGEYSLTTKSGQVYMLSGDGSLLGDHLGEQVRITGAQASASSTAAGTPGAAATPPSGGAATGGTPYGATGTTGSQPGAPNQSQAGTMPGQSTATTPPAGGTPGAATNAAQTQPGTAAAGSGSRFQVSNLTKVSNFCNMPQPH
jgi:hypothetical protein